MRFYSAEESNKSRTKGKEGEDEGISRKRRSLRQRQIPLRPSFAPPRVGDISLRAFFALLRRRAVA